MVVDQLALIVGIALIWIGIAILLDATTRFVANRHGWTEETADRVWGTIVIFYGGLSLLVYYLYV